MNQLPNSLREALARQTAGDTHPSSDVLTAFAEHSLPNRESQQITDHLARCVDCREVVFLASAAVEEPAREEQELMPEVAVPRISPALQAKTADARSAASTGPAKEAIPESPSRESRWRWAWVPVAAGVLIVSALLVQRSQFTKNAPQSSATIAGKEPLPSATTSPTSPAPPAPEPSPNLTTQKPLSKSAPAHGKPAQPSGTSNLVVSELAGPPPSGPGARASVESQSLSASNATLEYKPAPAAIPRQNSFVESEGQKPSALAMGSQSVLEKPRVGLLPAVVTPRQWRVTSDGYLEHSTSSGTWTLVLTDQPAKFRAVSVIGDTVWAGGSGGTLFQSKDGGQTWNKNQLSEASNVEAAAIVSIRFSDGQHGVITTDAGSRWSTSDGGQTWTKQ